MKGFYFFVMYQTQEKFPEVFESKRSSLVRIGRVFEHQLHHVLVNCVKDLLNSKRAFESIWEACKEVVCSNLSNLVSPMML